MWGVRNCRTQVWAPDADRLTAKLAGQGPVAKATPVFVMKQSANEGMHTLKKELSIQAV
jgi:hypothetical protein